MTQIFPCQVFIQCLRDAVPQTYTTDIYFPTVSEAGSPRSKCQWNWGLSLWLENGALFCVPTWPLLYAAHRESSGELPRLKRHQSVLPRWYGGWESTCQYRGRVWSLSRNIPHTLGELRPVSLNSWAHMRRLLKPMSLKPVLHNKRSHRNEKPAHCNRESLCTATKAQSNQNINKKTQFHWIRASLLGPHSYDLNQPPYDYTLEVTNRFKGLDLIDRVPEGLCRRMFKLLHSCAHFTCWQGNTQNTSS